MGKKPVLLIAWDTETYKTRDTDGETILKPYLLGWYCVGQFYYSYEPHTIFFKFLAEQAEKYDLHLWCFNANYDLPAIYPEYLSTINNEHKIKYKVSRAKQFISFIYKDKNFNFRVFDASCWNVHIKSLKAWLTLVGRKKVEGFEYDKWDLKRTSDGFIFYDSEGKKHKSLLKDELIYLEEDCSGLLDVVLYQKKSRRYLYKLFGLNGKGRECTTFPSFAKSIINSVNFYENFDMSYRVKTKNRDLYKMMLASSCGGFTACNKSQNIYTSIEGKIKNYDVNQMYPFVMAKGIPKGEISDQIKWENYCTWYEIELSECEWIEAFSFISTPPLPSRWTTLKHHVFLLREYYEVVKDYMKTDLRIMGVYYQELCFKLRPIILKLIAERIRIKNEPPSLKRTFKELNIKLFANSIYGKAAEQTYEEECFYDQTLKDFMTYPDEKKEFSYTLSGAYVSQYARSYLIKNLIKEIESGNTFLYCDTDSLKFIENTPVKLKISPIKLGWFKEEKWHPEISYTHFYTSGKIKKYLLFHSNHPESYKVVLSGVSNAVRECLTKYADKELIKLCYCKNSNVLIKAGKLSRDRNKWGQLLLEPLDISLNGFLKENTHIATFNPKEKKWTVKEC